MQIKVDDLSGPEIAGLLEQHVANMYTISPPESVHALPLDQLRESNITFWSVWENGELLGCGALKHLDSQHGEIKSMRTAPQALGRGVGRKILHHIVAGARSRAYRRLSLETGSTKPFAAALREGFVPCGPFGEYENTPFTRFFTREL